MQDMHPDWMAQMRRDVADERRMRESARRHLIVLALLVGGFLAMALLAAVLVLVRL